MNFKTPRPETFSVSGRVLVLQGFASKFAHSARKDSNLLPPSGEVARSADRGSYVILSVSEISHRTINKPDIPSLRAQRRNLPGG